MILISIISICVKGWKRCVRSNTTVGWGWSFVNQVDRRWRCGSRRSRVPNVYVKILFEWNFSGLCDSIFRSYLRDDEWWFEESMFWDVVGRVINDIGFEPFFKLPEKSNDKSEPGTSMHYFLSTNEKIVWNHFRLTYNCFFKLWRRGRRHEARRFSTWTVSLNRSRPAFYERPFQNQTTFWSSVVIAVVNRMNLRWKSWSGMWARPEF